MKTIQHEAFVNLYNKNKVKLIVNLKKQFYYNK